MRSDDLWEAHARWWQDEFTDGVDPEYTEQILPLAAAVPLRVATETYPLEAANDALNDLRRGHIRGAKVLKIN